MPEPRLCAKCTGQLPEGAVACPWCGSPTAEAGSEGTRVGEPSPQARAAAQGRKDVGLSCDVEKLKNLPPPPQSRPITALNPGQIVLRALIVVLVAYILVQVSQPLLRMIEPPLCAAMPDSQFCRHPEE